MLARLRSVTWALMTTSLDAHSAGNSIADAAPVYDYPKQGNCGQWVLYKQDTMIFMKREGRTQFKS